MDVATALGAAKQLDEAVGLIGKVLGKLKAKPDAAALKLAEALDEIGKTNSAVDAGVSSYMGLAFASENGVLDHQVLLAVQGGRLLTEVERGRGHCHRIGMLYRAFLDRWFARVLDPTEQLKMKEVFATLGEADFDLFKGLVGLAQLLQQEADDVCTLLLAGSATAARDRVRKAYPELKALRVELGASMTRLYALRNEFVAMADVV